MLISRTPVRDKSDKLKAFLPESTKNTCFAFITGNSKILAMQKNVFFRAMIVLHQVVQLVEDGGGAVLEPKDLLEPQDVGYIELNCSRGRVKHEKTRLFKAKYVFDCVRKSRLLPNLSEYLCKQKEDRSVDGNIEGRMRDPFEVCYDS